MMRKFTAYTKLYQTVNICYISALTEIICYLIPIQERYLRHIDPGGAYMVPSPTISGG